jgi:hypothetical protein
MMLEFTGLVLPEMFGQEYSHMFGLASSVVGDLVSTTGPIGDDPSIG